MCEYRRIAIVLEVKIAETFRELESRCDAAIAQIRERQYDKHLADDCYERVVRYGVAFYKKACKVRMDNEQD